MWEGREDVQREGYQKEAEDLNFKCNKNMKLHSLVENPKNVRMGKVRNELGT